MKKTPSEMTLEELWKLFPISLTAHQNRWAVLYAEMEARLAELLSDCRVIRVSHIGSTAICGIWAKDIVDILLELGDGAALKCAAKTLEHAGFCRMSTEKQRISLNWGYTENGFADKVYHVHLRREGDHDELFFRDYLNDHPEIAAEYERLKLALWPRFAYNRDAYTEAKTAFIQKWTAAAKKRYAGRYEAV